MGEGLRRDGVGEVGALPRQLWGGVGGVWGEGERGGHSFPTVCAVEYSA